MSILLLEYSLDGLHPPLQHSYLGGRWQRGVPSQLKLKIETRYNVLKFFTNPVLFGTASLRLLQCPHSLNINGRMFRSLIVRSQGGHSIREGSSPQVSQYPCSNIQVITTTIAHAQVQPTGDQGGLGALPRQEER